AVIHILGKAGFLACQNAEPVTTAFRSLRLKLVSQPSMPIAHVFDHAPAVDFSIAIDGDIRDTHINTQHIVNVDRVGRFNLSSGEHVPVTTHEGKIAFTATEGEQLALAFATHEGDRLPAIESPDRYGCAFEAQNAVIKRDSTQRHERAHSVLVQ